MPVHPAADGHLLAGMLLPQLSTVVVPACPAHALLVVGRRHVSLQLLCRQACADCCCRASEPVLPAGLFGSSSQAAPSCIWKPAQIELAAGLVLMQEAALKLHDSWDPHQASQHGRTTMS